MSMKMFLRSIAICFILLKLPLALSRPQNCQRCAQRAHNPTGVSTRGHIIYYEPAISRMSSPIILRNQLADYRSTANRPEYSRHRAGNQRPFYYVSPTVCHRRIREIKPEISVLPHDVNLNEDSIVPARVIRQCRNDDKNLPDGPSNTSTAADSKNGQELKLNVQNQKITKRTPVVPSPRVKVSRDQKVIADVLAGPVSVPASSKQVTGADIELNEAIREPFKSTGKLEQSLNNQSVNDKNLEPSVFRESQDSPMLSYPVRRYAQFLQTPENQILMIPPGSRIIQAPIDISHEDLVNTQPIGMYDTDYDFVDYVITPEIHGQIEKPETPKKNMSETNADRKIKNVAEMQKIQQQKNGNPKDGLIKREVMNQTATIQKP